MTAGLKIAVVGAGSTYTPELVSGLSRVREALPVHTLTLMDPDAHRLEVVGGFARRMLEHERLDTVVELTVDRTAALRDADVVLIQLRVGGQAARLGDETLPLRHGCIGQETTGVGGAAKALRTVPVVLDVADEARRVAKPDAWVIDFTNPVGIVTRALLDAGHRAIGLCNFAIGMQRWAADTLRVEPHRVQVDPVGLNHFSWIRRILLDGEDVLPAMIADRMDDLTAHVPFAGELVESLGAIPSSYLSFYYHHDRILAEQRRSRPRADVVREVEAALLTAYADHALRERPDELSKRGGAHYSDAAVDLLVSLFTGDGATHVLDVHNQGTLSGLAPTDVVEVLCRVDRDGAAPLPQPPVPADFAGRIAAVIGYERLIARAAVTGDVTLLKRALLAHPLIGQWDLVDRLVPEMLSADAAHLPQFARR
jgi:6-phospho-beta-glucosidase